MRTFKGGIHPPEMKDMSKGAELETIEMPNRLILPVSQHIGVPSKSIVEKGDEVKRGQVIAEAVGYVSVPLHAPTSGKIIAKEQKTNLLGKVCDHIVIESDGKNEWLEGCNIERDWRMMEAAELKAIIRDAGIVGMGGAAFPTHVKLSPPEGIKIDTVILNGIECEPYLTCDYRLMMEHTRGIVEGLKIIMKILGAGRGIVGIEANKVDAFEKMRDALWAENSVAVYLLEVKYPQGAEKQLIDALAGREIPAGKLPLDVGIVVQNVATANAVFEAVTKNIPLIERPVTITGDGIGKPANLMVPIGTPISVLLKRQEVSAKTRKLIMGGPMMGLAVPDAEFPILKGTSGVLALINTPNYMPGPCIRCGKCIEVCPLRGVAAEMGAAIEAGLVEKYEQLHVLDCVECGTCTFACPAHRSIVHHVKKAKAEYEAYRAAKEKKEKEES